jgi:hypothetical protein
MSTAASLAGLVGEWTLLALHEHPLPRRRSKGASFVCASCRQLRYDVSHACEKCAVFALCPPCFDKARGEQEECYREAEALELRDSAEQAAKRSLWGGASTSVGPGAAVTGLPPLLHACLVGDFVAAKDIVDKSDFMKDLDLEATMSHGPYQGRTALIFAAEGGHKNIVELLLTRDTQRDAVDNRGLTALMHAAYNGHLDVVDELLFNGAQVDRVAFRGYTAMLLAANRGHGELVRRLLDAGASPLARTPKGRNAVLVAAFNGHVGVLKQLAVVPGIELDARDDEGYNARDAARANHQPAVELALNAIGGGRV